MAYDCSLRPYCPGKLAPQEIDLSHEEEWHPPDEAHGDEGDAAAGRAAHVECRRNRSDPRQRHHASRDGGEGVRLGCCHSVHDAMKNQRPMLGFAWLTQPPTRTGSRSAARPVVKANGAVAVRLVTTRIDVVMR